MVLIGAGVVESDVGGGAEVDAGSAFAVVLSGCAGVDASIGLSGAGVAGGWGAYRLQPVSMLIAKASTVKLYIFLILKPPLSPIFYLSPGRVLPRWSIAAA